MGNREEQFGILENFKAQVSATWDSPYAEGFSECLLFATDFSTWVECLKDIPQCSAGIPSWEKLQRSLL